MPTGKLIALFLAIMGIADLLLGFFVVEPRVPVERRALIRKLFMASTAFMLVLASLFWFGVIAI